MNIPNLLSALRLCLIPVFCGVYLNAASSSAYVAAAIILGVSGLTDMLDGYIARHYRMETAIGKILDPLADKMTQVAVCLCIALRVEGFWPLVIIFVCKESLMGIAGIIMTRGNYEMPRAKWFGKLATIMFYVLVFLVVMFPEMERLHMKVLMWTSCGFMLFAFFMYIPDFFRLQKNAIRSEPVDSDGK